MGSGLDTQAHRRDVNMFNPIPSFFSPSPRCFPFTSPFPQVDCFFSTGEVDKKGRDMLATCGSYDAIELILVPSLAVFRFLNNPDSRPRFRPPTIYSMLGRTGSVWPHFHENWHESGIGAGYQTDAVVELETHGWEPGRRQVHGAGIRFDSKFGGQCTL